MKTTLSRAEFARALGFADYDALTVASQPLGPHGLDWSYFLTALPDGRFAAWDDVELAADRVTYHATWRGAAEEVADAAACDYNARHEIEYPSLDLNIDHCFDDAGRIIGFRLSVAGVSGTDERFGAWGA